MEEDEEFFMAKSYVSTENVLLDEISPEHFCGTVEYDKLSWLTKSFLDIGVLPIGTIFLYQLRESQSEGCRFKFGVIDGAHRVIALKRLREAYPTIILPISFPARIYKDIEFSDINIFSSILNGRKICYKELQELEE